MLKKMPFQFDFESIQKKYPVIYENQVNLILQTEVLELNNLLRIIGDQLTSLIEALNG